MIVANIMDAADFCGIHMHTDGPHPVSKIVFKILYRE